MILTSRRRHFYLVGQSKHKVGACGVSNQASAVLAGNELPFVAFNFKVPFPSLHNKSVTRDKLFSLHAWSTMGPVLEHENERI
ncbi:hypothetical protein TNCV_4315321 [Trichonephila clavipes]|nr:hypothetical protein TNCV_4315321 [Trichonephila clavipes]